METYKVSFKFEVNNHRMTVNKEVTTNTYTMIVENKVQELCTKYHLTPSDIHIEVHKREKHSH